ncbi:hypothetical protein ANO14919_023180 [Xylariales sp. No.14919]|nr:hypothetical protein ANO14919_023180 [Xylariales sp. No.14919]
MERTNPIGRGLRHRSVVTRNISLDFKDNFRSDDPRTRKPYSSEKQRPQSTLGTSPYRRKPIERSFLPVLIQDKRIEALPDTNATCNVITEQFAQSIGAHIDRSAARQCAFTNAIGLQSRSVGETSLQVAFPDNPLKTWQCTFAVIQNCPESLVFGDRFLRVVTETVTKFRHRLKKAISTLAKRTWRLMHMQYPRQKLECFIDSGRVLANADTGSDVDLVSFNYAKLRGWDVDPLPHDEGFVILSDGTIAKVFGHVDVDLFLRGTINKGKRFYVLDGLISDVVLGDTTVDELDVFNAHIDSFVDLGEVEEVEDFFMIEWVQRLDKFEAHVDRLLVTHSTATGSPVAAPINTWGRIYRAAKRQGGREVDYKPEEIKAELRRRLQDLDIIEIQLSSQSSKKMETLVGNELRREQADDRARKTRYRELRFRILRSISDLP